VTVRPLVLAAHGSPHAAHRPAVEALAAAVAAADDVDVHVGWLDFFEPALGDAARAASVGGRGPVVVPLLLAAGHHARVDVPAKVATVAGATVTPVLGPDPLLDAALDRLLAEAGAGRAAAVVLGAAGSSDPDALAQTERAGEALARRLGRPVVVGYASGSGRPVAEAVEQAKAQRTEVAVATYVLSPGTLAERIATRAYESGVTVVTPALGSAPEVVELVLTRWRAAGD
jgi:sirohydrochlorin ferrochelatase